MMQNFRALRSGVRFLRRSLFNATGKKELSRYKRREIKRRHTRSDPMQKDFTELRHAVLCARAERFFRFVTFFVPLLGVLVLIGWEFDIESLKRPFPGLVPVNPITAVAFALSGFALWLRRETGSGANSVNGFRRRPNTARRSLKARASAWLTVRRIITRHGRRTKAARRRRDVLFLADEARQPAVTFKPDHSGSPSEAGTKN